MATKQQKMIVSDKSSFENIIKSDALKVYIDGYAYIAITSRSVSVSNTVTKTVREDGLEYCDHSFRDPTSMSYTIVVSKLNGSEYNKLKEIYMNRKLVTVKSIAYNCPNAIMSDFSITDEMFDTLTINVSFKEVLVSGTNYTLEIESLFQTNGGKKNSGTISTSTNTNLISTQETKNIDQAINALTDNSQAYLMQIPKKQQTMANVYIFDGNDTIAGMDRTKTTINEGQKYEHLVVTGFMSA